MTRSAAQLLASDGGVLEVGASVYDDEASSYGVVVELIAGYTDRVVVQHTGRHVPRIVECDHLRVESPSDPPPITADRPVVAEVVEWDVYYGDILGCWIRDDDGGVAFRAYRRPVIADRYMLWDGFDATWTADQPSPRRARPPVLDADRNPVTVGARVALAAYPQLVGRVTDIVTREPLGGPHLTVDWDGWRDDADPVHPSRVTVIPTT